MTANDILNLVRGAVRPFISVTGWGVFLVIAVIAVLRYLDANLAREIIIGFVGIVGTIVGVWMGSRTAKTGAGGG